MKILILGATGPTGRLIVNRAIESGHEVTALVRSKAKAEAAGLQGAALVEGDATDPAGLNRVLMGCDAVICALGTGVSPFREVTLLSTATRALVQAMEANGVKRLVCITGLGAGDSRGHGGFFFDWIFMPLLLRKVYADKDRQEAVIHSSQLDWIIVRPTVLNDKPASNQTKALTDLSGVHGGTISRADVAAFTVQQLAQDAWLQQAPLITW
jgi:putative NADH-flavin reductase